MSWADQSGRSLSSSGKVKLQTKVTQGSGRWDAALAMVFKLSESAQARWCTVNGAHLVALELAPEPACNADHWSSARKRVARSRGASSL
ncbi:hypothetical protein H1D24_28260 [Streptomyces sp. PSKA28]|uniref:Uncharacterized protein n=1 Tax=Streptomyces himalayensis subsp. himalayensis TaxID=2756131 RepID=A0A7W0IBY3_9ACTN|nr:hypothetical protein [Streptomyces himalayensis]MBA2949609.1 hypothetical protein [Streptomyces himalayensis subsp. himalayensis]